MGAANDTVVNIANAAAGGVKAGIDFFAPGSAASQGIQGFIEQGDATKSLQARIAEEKLQRSMESEDWKENISGVGKYVVENPLQTAAMAVGNFVLPGAAIKGARGIAGVMGAGAQATGRTGLAASMGTGALLAGGDASGDAYDQVMNSPNLRDLPEDERRRMATEAASNARWAPAAIGAVGGAFGAEAALAKGGTKSLFRTTASEFASEAFEEGATKASANLAAGAFDQAINPMKGVVGAATLGGIMGAGTGAAVGALTKDRTILGGSNEFNAGNTSDGSGVGKAINIHDASTMSTQQIINQNTGVPEGQPNTNARRADIEAALNEPSGTRVTDPATGIEREMSAGELAQLRGGAPTANQQSQQVAEANAQQNQQLSQEQQQQQAAQTQQLRAQAIDAFGMKVDPERFKPAIRTILGSATCGLFNGSSPCSLISSGVILDIVRLARDTSCSDGLNWFGL